ncbi:hypothetical protein vBBceHLY2_00141 [Bacillus phage vB_BceH_LY2]|nr:hypothetical protein vBBceHLY2_00141 [Bacillus phage vB_BceH_LY2]
MMYVGVCHDCLMRHGDIIADKISKGCILGVHIKEDKENCYLEVMHPEELTLKEKVEGRIKRYKEDVEYFKKVDDDSVIRLFEGKLQSMKMVLQWIKLEEEK